MLGTYSNIEDFILNFEIPSFRKYLESARPLEKQIILKSLLLLINGDACKDKIVLHNTNLPAVCYLSHDGLLEIATPKDFLSQWFDIKEFNLNLKQHNLPNIAGAISNNKLRLKLSDSPIKWEEMRQFTNYSENYYLSFDEKSNLSGKISTETANNLKKIDLTSVESRICYMPFCQNFKNFSSKCQTYKINLEFKEQETELPPFKANLSLPNSNRSKSPKRY